MTDVEASRGPSVYMAGLPPGANVATMTVMATTMPYSGAAEPASLRQAWSGTARDPDRPGTSGEHRRTAGLEKLVAKACLALVTSVAGGAPFDRRWRVRQRGFGGDLAASPRTPRARPTGPRRER